MNATKARPRGDRYFVVNGWQGKNGWREQAAEFESHEDACRAALMAVTHLQELTGDLPETFEVFVGSKTTLDRRLRAWQ